MPNSPDDAGLTAERQRQGLSLRPGLPTPAARIAAQRGETLTYSEALLDAREAKPFVDTDALDVLRSISSGRTAVARLVREVDRLRGVEADRIVLLERLAFEEAQRYDMDLKYPLRRLDEDCYLPWSGSCDRPATWGTMTRVQALARGWLPMHLDRADEHATKDGRVLYNRAGPGEKCLTIAALKEAYASRETYTEFRLTPDKIEPHTSSGREDPATGEWDDQTVYWVPWLPEETPKTLPAGWADRF